MEDQNLSEKESLELIAKMINQAKNYYYESGMGALLWGFTNVICFTLAYLDATVKGFDLPFTPFLLMIITFIIQLYYDRKENMARKVTTYLDEAHKYVWMSFGIAVFIMTVMGAITHMGYVTLPLLLLIFGIPTFISGCLSKFPAMIIGGIICWALSIVAFLWPGYYAFLLVAAGATAAWIIPGLMMRAEFKKELRKEIKT